MESSEPPPEMSLLQRIRNTWEFSNLMQYIFIFGKAVKIDEDFSIDVGPSIMSTYPPLPSSVLLVILFVAPTDDLLSRIWKLNASSLDRRKNWLRLAWLF